MLQKFRARTCIPHHMLRLVCICLATLMPTSAPAIVDVIAKCVVENGKVVVRTKAGPVQLSRDTPVNLRFGHVGHGFLPVHISLPGGVTHVAKSLSIFNAQGEGPPDVVRRTPDGAVWHHYPSGAEGKTVEITLICPDIRP